MTRSLSPAARWAVLACASTGLIFDGIELGLMPVASLSVSKSLLGEAYTPELGGVWFARFTAALPSSCLLSSLSGFGPPAAAWPSMSADLRPQQGCLQRGACFRRWAAAMPAWEPSAGCSTDWDWS